MKLGAIRVAEVGPFRDPVAVEDMSGGLDVLIGPNELGKSTLFRAIETVFLKSHRMSGQAVEAMMPRGGGGSPLIEADFAAAGGRWRITKRFGKSKSAELIDLASNRVVARGPDAETRLAELIGAAPGGQFGLLWVGQQRSLVVPAPDQDADKKRGAGEPERTTLRQAIAREVDAVAGADLARRVAAHVRTALAEYVTGKRGEVKKNTRYDAALARRAALRQSLDSARAEASRADERLQRLERLVGEREAVASDAILVRRSDTVRDAETAAARAEAAMREQQILVEREEHARLSLQEASQRLQDFGSALDAFAKLDAEQMRFATDQPRLAEEAAAAADQAAASEADISRLEQQLAAIDATDRVAQHRCQLAQECEALGAVQRKVQGAVAELSKTTVALAANRCTPERLRSWREASRVLTLAQSRAELPAALDIEIALLPEAEGLVRIGGAVAPRSGKLSITQVTDIEIAGVGRLRLLPANAAERAARQAEVEQAGRTLAGIEGEIGARSEQVEALGQARAEIERTARVLSERIDVLAPDGLQALEGRVAVTRAELAEVERLAGAAHGQSSPDDGAAGREHIARRLAEARESRDAVRDLIASGKHAMEMQAVRATEVRGQLGALAARLGPDSLRLAERDRLAGLVDAAKAELVRRSSAREMAAQMAPREDEVRTLIAARDAARQALQTAESAQLRLAREIATLEGQISVAGEAEIGPEIARLEGELSAVDRQIEHYEHEVAALDMLARTLGAAEAEHRGRFLDPVVRRLTPYLAHIFPEARAVFNEGFALEALERAGDVLPIDVLSDGTREQLAILVRLGFGRLLAETGAAVPVILDDALVYSDDTRIGHMFDVLKMASQQHQVLVFTCRAATFAGLDGRRLQLTPWQPPR